MEIDLYYDAWHVGDGDPAIGVGSRWTTTPLLQPIEPLPVQPGSHDSASGDARLPGGFEFRDCSQHEPRLRALSGEPAGVEFVADAVTGGLEGLPFSVLRTPGFEFAVEGREHGRICGVGRIVHDTHIVDDGLVRKVSREFVVTRVRYLPHIYEPVEGRDGDFVLRGYDVPVDVESTHMKQSGWSQPGAFLISIETDTARPVRHMWPQARGRIREWLQRRTRR